MIRCPLPLAAPLLGLLAAGCSAGPPVSFPTPAPPATSFPGEGLRARATSVDITPFPGYGLSGNGPEGARSAGHRGRLYAHALVLVDPNDQAIALVAADLAHPTALLHRLVGHRLAPLGIGPDRLLLAATHTHAGPGHIYEARQLNESSASVAGFDSAFADSLAGRIAAGVAAALADLRPARAVWGMTPVWGETRIRSLPAILRNRPEPAQILPAPPGLALEQRLVDPRLWMLRVDVRVGDRWAPHAAFSVFAIHGTGNPTVNRLYDGDIHGLVNAAVAAGIAASYPRAPGDPPVVSLLVQGSHGDVSPDWPPESRCHPPRLLPERRADGPHALRFMEWQPAPAPERARCLAAARTAMRRVADGIAGRALALFRSLDDRFPAQPYRLDRRFEALDFRDEAESLGTCPTPALGTSAAGGAPDARTRVRGFRILGLIDAGFAEGAARRPPRGCHAEKRELLGPIARGLVSPGLPGYAPLQLVRIGDRLLGGIPAEVSTVAGLRMSAAMAEAARAGGLGTSEAIVVSLANGFLQYVTTREEYSAQHYEGGSTLFGPNQAAAFAARLSGLTARMAAGEPCCAVEPVVFHPGKRRSIVTPASGPAPPAPEPPTAACAGDTLVVRFERGRAGDWIGDRPPLRIVERGPDGRWRDRVTDLQAEVEVWLTRAPRRGAARWEARWQTPGPGVYGATLAAGPVDPASWAACG